VDNFELAEVRDRLEAARIALPLGRSRHWIKSKNPAAPAVKREAEEDCGEVGVGARRVAEAILHR
jgi:hypothetical protein